MARRGRARRAAAAEVQGPARANGRRLTVNQRARLALAETLAAGGWRDRQRAAHIVRVVERELAEAVEAEAVDAGIADALARAEARGEAFEVATVAVGEWRRTEMGGIARRDGAPILDVQLVRRASRVDGLVSLHKSGALTDREREWGDAVRALFAKAVPPVAVSDLSPMGGEPDPGRMLVAVAEAGEALGLLSRIRARIGDERAWAVLEAVAGRGATVRSLGAGGDLNERNRDLLKAALATSSTVLREAKGDVEERRLANQER